VLGLTRYQWLVLFAAWLGWGFDVFDGLLFNYVSGVCVPNLLGLSLADKATEGISFYWTAALTSLLLIGWAIGGVLFGKITDRLGRARTLLLTMLTYALGTAACAFAPNIWVLALFRFVASLGIGGEWAAGASLVAETLPKEKRVLGGALLYTSAPAGLFLATFVNDLLLRKVDFLVQNPDLAWRAVFLTGLVPAAVAFVIRLGVKEPDTWKPAEEPRVAELFSPELRQRTVGGMAMAIVALVTWWSCSAFIPKVAAYLATRVLPKLPPPELALRKVEFITHGTTAFNLGGLIGTLLTVPAALHLGRRKMFLLYFALAAAALLLTFGPAWPVSVRLTLLFSVGLTVFGVFGAFTFYLPELFPTRLRGTGAGFTYNIGRLLTAPFPFAVGAIVQAGADPLVVMTAITVVPVVGTVLVLTGVAVETRGELSN
jgi:MFS family permease